VEQEFSLTSDADDAFNGSVGMCDEGLAEFK